MSNDEPIEISYEPDTLHNYINELGRFTSKDLMKLGYTEDIASSIMLDMYVKHWIEHVGYMSDEAKPQKYLVTYHLTPFGRESMKGNAKPVSYRLETVISLSEDRTPMTLELLDKVVRIAQRRGNVRTPEEAVKFSFEALLDQEQKLLHEALEGLTTKEVENLKREGQLTL